MKERHKEIMIKPTRQPNDNPHFASQLGPKENSETVFYSYIQTETKKIHLFAQQFCVVVAVVWCREKLNFDGDLHQNPAINHQTVVQIIVSSK